MTNGSRLRCRFRSQSSLRPPAAQRSALPNRKRATWDNPPLYRILPPVPGVVSQCCSSSISRTLPCGTLRRPPRGATHLGRFLTLPNTSPLNGTSLGCCSVLVDISTALVSPASRWEERLLSPLKGSCKTWSRHASILLVSGAMTMWAADRLAAEEMGKLEVKSSHAPVVMSETFEQAEQRMSAAKPVVMKRQMDLLNQRYDLSDTPAQGVSMSGGKAVQGGVRAKLPQDVTWAKLSNLSPEEIKNCGLWPKGFFPPAASRSSRRRHGLSEISHRRDSQTGRPRPDAVRPGLRLAGSVPARFPNADSAPLRHPMTVANRHRGQRPLPQVFLGQAPPSQARRPAWPGAG